MSALAMIAGSAGPDDARLRRLTARVHELGPRPLYELIREVLDGADLCARLERLDPAICQYLGASEFPDEYRT
jgi:hypothetical protein